MRTMLGWAARLILVLAFAGAGWSAAGVHGPASPATLAGASVPAAPTFDVAADAASGLTRTLGTSRTTASVGLRLAGSGSLAPLDGSTSSSAHPQGRAGAHHAPRRIQGSGGRSPWNAAPALPPLPPYTTTLPPPAGSRD